ncbi:MAG: hypothetical protein US25_C0007G0013 [Candidatus Moranbacteria bacterium GW2011_GWE1_36_7]|nr:MAG: hypothetical protein UR99_C0012G0016 [Candidatus Moranbacteria bacterium GW2011_GWD2_36_12]KKQ06559.1 MAG: hypothetical protein US16_C0014G0016 [Candidatus Moranbacteria bacterium GW2011_GWE2_36_40]KKQ15326.1 MAG: hypothetical protein US25_C0007G0013 [Candidatus Moranbacteria bacterium GW2011_GWE1_36_7]
MSGKMLPKKRGSKKHLEKITSAAEKRQIDREIFCQEMKLRYKKILISNYPLLVALFLLVAVLCWATNSFGILLVALICFYFIILMHHQQRISKSEKNLHANDYQLTAAVMTMCSVIGVLVTIGLLSAVYFLN